MSDSSLIISCVIGSMILIGIVLSRGKGAFLIAGLNTMSKKEKEKYDIPALCKFMGKIMFAFVLSMLFLLADEFFPGYYLLTIGQVLLGAVLLFVLVFGNVNKRFKKKND